jgi:uncharacterized membrane protein YhaH (DUF805 family)
MHYYFDVFKRAFDFGGRSRRAEYWYFVLFNFIVSIAFAAISAMIGDKRNILGYLYAFFGLIPAIALHVRRLHDIGKSAWNLLFLFIPILGPVVLIVFSLFDSDIGLNAYGPNPKGVTDIPEPPPAQ